MEQQFGMTPSKVRSFLANAGWVEQHPDWTYSWEHSGHDITGLSWAQAVAYQLAVDVGKVRSPFVSTGRIALALAAFGIAAMLILLVLGR